MPLTLSADTVAPLEDLTIELPSVEAADHYQLLLLDADSQELLWWNVDVDQPSFTLQL